MLHQRTAHVGAETRDHVDHSRRETGLLQQPDQSRVEAEVNSDGLMTTVQPAANAGASFQASSISGEFHGVMMAATPSGSLRV